MQTLSQTILAWNRLAQRPSIDFAATALPLLRACLPFDRGLLVSHEVGHRLTVGQNQAKRTSQIFSPQELEQLVPHAGTAGAVLNHVDRPAEVARALATLDSQRMLLMPEVERSEHFLLIHRASGAGFSERERTDYALLWPHLRQAIELNLRLLLDDFDHARPARALFLLNAFGTIERADPRARALLLREWPTLHAQRLPHDAVESLIARGFHRARHHHLRATRKGLYLVCSAAPLSVVHLLSPSELSVARQYAQGCSYKEIAQVLGTSPYTVRNQLVRVYQKLGVHNKVEMSALLVQEDGGSEPAPTNSLNLSGRKRNGGQSENREANASFPPLPSMHSL